MIQSITIPPAQYEAIRNELKAHFADIWQNVNTLNELETFISRIRACGLEDLAGYYNQRFLSDNAYWLENEKEKAESLGENLQQINPFKDGTNN